MILWEDEETKFHICKSIQHENPKKTPQNLLNLAVEIFNVHSFKSTDKITI